jgi:hypothetical protein
MPKELKTIKVQKNAWQTAKIEAAKQNITIEEYVTQALTSKLEQIQDKPCQEILLCSFCRKEFPVDATVTQIMEHIEECRRKPKKELRNKQEETKQP